MNFLFEGLIFRVLSPMAIEILKIDIEANKQDIKMKLPGLVITAKKNNSVSKLRKPAEKF